MPTAFGLCGGDLSTVSMVATAELHAQASWQVQERKLPLA
jgi:hypothetical protein